MTDRIAGQPPQSPSAQVLRDAPRLTRADARLRADGEADGQLSDADRQRVAELARRDREVRAHEMAHVAAGAGLVISGARYEYTTGPDGKRYAVGGEVRIDTSPGRTPEETIDKAARIQAAALAPADPSPQDRQIAAQAAQMAMQARIELASQQEEPDTPTNAESTPPASSSNLIRAYAQADDTTSPGRVLDLFA